MSPARPSNSASAITEASANLGAFPRQRGYGRSLRAEHVQKQLSLAMTKARGCTKTIWRIHDASFEGTCAAVGEDARPAAVANLALRITLPVRGLLAGYSLENGKGRQDW